METISSVKEVRMPMKSEESSSQENNIPISLEKDFPILTGKNYQTWKDKMEKFLKNNGLWDYVTGEKHQPENPSSGEYEDWIQKQSDIISIFRSKCGARTLPYIERQDINLIWNQLVTMYEFTYSSETGITNYTWCLPFYRAIVDGNWKIVSQLLSKNEGALTARLTSEGDLPLHVAVKKEKVEIAKELVNKMSANDLSRQGKDDRTILHIAAQGGNKEIVEAIVDKDHKLVMIKSKYYMGRIPIIVAARAGNKDVVNYLYPITIRQDGNKNEDHTGERDITRATILTRLIFGDFYGLAFDLLRKYPHLVLTKDDCEYTAMQVLSVKPAAFKSSLPTKKSVKTLGYNFIYSFKSVLDVHPDAKDASSCKRGDVENSSDADGDSNQGHGPFNNYLQHLWFQFSRLFQNVLIELVPGLKHIHEEKLKHYEASKLLKELWRLVSKIEDLEPMKDALSLAMFQATELGIVEFIEECIINCPQLLLQLRITSDNVQADAAGQTIFHHAITNRQEMIFGLIHHLGPMKNDLAVERDASGNRMSHLAAIKAPTHRLNQVPGAALQMQRELLWYKEVESIVPSIHELYENNKKERPRILFTEEHKQLVKDGATWMKDTATQCMVVATLITTIMFGAVFTVPSHTGGGETNTYIQGKFPIVFVISNIFALCSSVASMLMFLAIITSRYAEEDFLSTLPRMLMMGLFFLFVSIVGMMIAFISAILFMLHYDIRLWVSLPIVILASIPVTIYALVELPLFIQLMFTSSSAVFGKKKN